MGSDVKIQGRKIKVRRIVHTFLVFSQSLNVDPEENHQFNGEKVYLDKEENYEDGEPELKRARQESPKLSSLLLAGPKKTKEKKSNLSNLDNTGFFIDSK